jgi:O-antigen/teichoic acid export membrane protein
MDRHRLWIRAGLSFILLGIFSTLLVLIFYIELPQSAEITSATLLGALVGNLTSTLSYWFDSTEHDNSPHSKSKQ